MESSRTLSTVIETAVRSTRRNRYYWARSLVRLAGGSLMTLVSLSVASSVVVGFAVCRLATRGGAWGLVAVPVALFLLFWIWRVWLMTISRMFGWLRDPEWLALLFPYRYHILVFLIIALTAAWLIPAS